MSLLSAFERNKDSIVENAYALIGSWIAVIIATAVPLVGMLASAGLSDVGNMLR